MLTPSPTRFYFSILTLNWNQTCNNSIWYCEAIIIIHVQLGSVAGNLVLQSSSLAGQMFSARWLGRDRKKRRLETLYPLFTLEF